MAWVNVPLYKLCEEFTDGDWIETRHQSTEGVRLIQTGNIGLGHFKNREDKARYVSDKMFESLKCFEVLPGDCLVSRLPDPAGRSCILPDLQTRMITSVDCTILRFNHSKLVPGFFSYFSQSKKYLEKVDDLTSGATRKRISRKNLGLIEVPVPPLSEQKRVVAILDQAFSEIDRARELTVENISNARKLFESYLGQVFTQHGEGRTVYRMSEICEITSRLVDPRENGYLDIPHVGAGNMVSKTGELIDVKTAREDGLISGKFLFDDSMVLYSKIRPYLMKVCRPDFVGLCSADVYPLSPVGKKLDKHYLFYLLLSKNFTEYAISGSGRAGMPKVNRSHLFNYKVALPTVDKQQEYAAKLDQVSVQSQKLVQLYTSKLEKFDELKNSLFQKAFSGELTQADATAKVAAA